jgi:AmpD protein
VNVDASHWLDSVERRPSPHCDDRPDRDDVSLIVVHGISLPPGRFGTGLVDDLFLGRLDCSKHPALSDLAGVRVSAHLFVERDGRVTQFVPFDRRAWHAGISSFRGRQRCNDFSIGIELEGADEVPYADAQYAVLVRILEALRRRYPRITLGAIVGHSDVAPGRKTDPGPAFDWVRVLREVRMASSHA